MQLQYKLDPDKKLFARKLEKTQRNQKYKIRKKRKARDL